MMNTHQMSIQGRLHIRLHSFLSALHSNGTLNLTLSLNESEMEVFCKPLPLRIFTLEANVVTYTTLFSTNNRALDCVTAFCGRLASKLMWRQSCSNPQSH